MEFKIGEKLLGTIAEITSEKLIISLREDTRGYVELQSTEIADMEELSANQEVYVTVEDHCEDGLLELSIDEILEEKSAEENMDYFLNGINPESIRNQYGPKEQDRPAKRIKKWTEEAAQGLEKLRRNRRNRTKEEFYSG